MTNSFQSLAPFRFFMFALLIYARVIAISTTIKEDFTRLARVITRQTRIDLRIPGSQTYLERDNFLNKILIFSKVREFLRSSLFRGSFITSRRSQSVPTFSRRLPNRRTVIQERPLLITRSHWWLYHEPFTLGNRTFHRNAYCSANWP